MNRKRLVIECVLVLIIWALVMMLVGKAKAQPELPPTPHTDFYVGCFDRVDGGLNVHWGYISNAPMHFIGSGYDFVTEVGSHLDAFIYRVPDELNPEFQVLGLGYYDGSQPIQMDVVTTYVDFTANGIPQCDSGYVPPLPTAGYSTPVPTATPYMPELAPTQQQQPRMCMVHYPDLVLVCY